MRRRWPQQPLVVSGQVLVSHHCRVVKAEYERRIRLAQHTLEARLDEDVSLAELADVAAMSRFHFHRVFSGVTGEPVVGYRRRLRLERAARQLIHTRRPILDIAIEAGYGSHEAFTRAFGDAFGVAPSRYREGDRRPGTPSRQRRRPDPIDVSVAELSERTLVARRLVGPVDQLGASWAEFVQWSHDAGLTGPDDGRPALWGLAHDDAETTPEDRYRYDACLELDSARPVPIAPSGWALRTVTVPAGQYAVTMHHGSFDTLANTYLALVGTWFPEHGHVLASEPIVEHYRRPDDAAGMVVTEVRVRIETRGWLR